MKKASITEAKNNLSALIDSVKGGSPVLIVDRGRPVARLEREGALDAPAVIEAFDRLKRLADGWHEVDANDGIREAAVRFVRVHPLRAADALQLAAAFVVAERRPSSLEVITLDERLAA